MNSETQFSIVDKKILSQASEEDRSLVVTLAGGKARKAPEQQETGNELAH